MGSDRPGALGFALLLMLALPGAEATHAAAPAAADRPAVAEPLAGADDQPVDEGAVAEEPAATPQHLLSTFGALALGVGGLLWMRRRTAEL